MPSDIKDIIKDKINKLVSATYLVTNFLDDLDQIKWKLRDKSLNLKDNLTLDVGAPLTSSVVPVERILSDISEIISLLDIAVLDRRASAMNFSILRQGYVNLQAEFQNYLAGDWYQNMLIPKTLDSSPENHRPDLSPRLMGLGPKPKAGVIGHDNGRQEKIITFIKQHNWSSTREIAQFIPNISSKTVQRELAELVRAGRLKKTGERRWSRYAMS